ncbi:hypothetical protein [Shewanella waksmanii]|uniref:hypothetical protein n=1 Tax=Shewanella waksmanii TaxID=213783 RepID=UPI0004906EA0|nr:hypothetical protein [Shewanella waksmanii]
MKNKLVFLSYLLLVFYSVSAIFIPRYISNDILLLDESEQHSQKFISDLIQSVEESEVPLTKEMVTRTIRGAGLIGLDGYKTAGQIVELIEQYAFILFGLLLFHLGTLMSARRRKNET